jgi:formylmethanofuran dehydrogenase subunit E
MDGLNLDTEKAEGKMISAIVELLGDVTKRLTDVEETTIAISDELDEIEEDLDAIEDYILDEEDDEDDWYDEDEDDEELWDDDEEYEEGFEYGDEDSIIYEVECACGEVINFDEETLEKGSMLCPNCGETLEFSVEEDEDEPMPF